MGERGAGGRGGEGLDSHPPTQPAHHQSNTQDTSRGSGRAEEEHTGFYFYIPPCSLGPLGCLGVLSFPPVRAEVKPACLGTHTPKDSAAKIQWGRPSSFLTPTPKGPFWRILRLTGRLRWSTMASPKTRHIGGPCYTTCTPLAPDRLSPHVPSGGHGVKARFLSIGGAT